MPPSIAAFDAAVAEHDDKLAALGFDIWVGSEPTFTDRFSASPEWNHQAVGGDKLARAESLVVALHSGSPGSMVLRSVGRQYPGEERPRWSLGLYRRRDGLAVWNGPPDPLLVASPVVRPPDSGSLAKSLSLAFEARGWSVLPLAQPPGVLLSLDSAVDPPDPGDPRLDAASIHERPIPASGLCDDLAGAGIYRFLLSCAEVAVGTVARIELPAFASPDMFGRVLAAIAEWAGKLPCLILAGYPPPVDATVEWTTITPDPAVIEINTAPDACASDFLLRLRRTHAAAAEQGLAPYRLYYNGAVADSGGGGQITLGGRTPLTSSFLRHHRLLPRLLLYFNRHPALSYFYAHDYTGSGGQSVRCDERGLAMFHELRLALVLLGNEDQPNPELLWRALAPFLADASGNSHRAEINIEKLWNPFLPERGRLGLVEFRALRMQHRPERATALACLLRAIVAMLATQETQDTLIDWGPELHQRFALPYYLERDLRAVLADLDAAGVGLCAPICEELLRDEFRLWRRIEFPGCALELRRALEFWPLLGDASSQDQCTSRLIDASTARVEVLLRPLEARTVGDCPALADWRVSAEGIELPLHDEIDQRGPVKVFAFRYRSFSPALGLHPTLGAQGRIHLQLWRNDQRPAWRVTLHEWRPEGGGYPGLPADLADAAARRSERVQVQLVDAPQATNPPPPGALDRWCLDLRYPKPC
ncbi:transglutaminase family protein [Accumulibacter sp.]|uniref:transglutaminase family protein n=1 Tax=Accumulibacter sp. TaxID=2053492 RepID=UPI0025DB6645|nr:transglutaminase family protein [Accumulibacter sp.]MCM8595314.1 transglutaminase family protein [Accumulibacter sp.]MCM8625269.1 transglutaminase family protein [Accumulibacter sp.]MDS4049461.1 transglutaminase family protein [Accumulibacter sp.]